MILSILIVPATVAHAGFFSFLGDLFGKSSVVLEREVVGAQNMALLQAAVHADPNPSKGGGSITIVENQALKAETSPRMHTGSLEGAAVPASDQISVYVVREGDSLSQIAEMFGVSMKTVMWANDIGSKGLIRPGQTLVILPISGVQYEVKKGDTLASIADKYQGDLEEIIDFNDMDADDSLTVGTTIIIPNGMLIEPTRSAAVATGPVKGTNSPAYDGYYLRPVSGGVRSQGLHGYNAIDIAAPIGTPVLASASGEVILSKYSEGNPWFGGYGNYIVLKHDNGTQTVYAHLSDNLVRRGWRVVQGQVIGYVGNTGRSTGPHLHFEVRGAQNPH